MTQSNVTTIRPEDAVRNLYWIRHGEYYHKQAAPMGTLVGSLTERGRMQVRIAGQALSDVSIDTLYVSTLKRGIESGDEIKAQLPGATICQTDTIQECLPGPARGLQTVLDPDSPRVKEGLAHSKAAFDTYFVPPGDRVVNDVFVSHGNLIRALVCLALDVDRSAWGKLVIFHASITHFVVGPDAQVHLLTFSEIGHMPRELRTMA